MYVWSSYIAEYGSTGQGCQSCSWSAEQGKNIPLSPCSYRWINQSITRYGWSASTTKRRRAALARLELSSSSILRGNSMHRHTHTYGKGMDRPGKVANPAPRGQPKIGKIGCIYNLECSTWRVLPRCDGASVLSRGSTIPAALV